MRTAKQYLWVDPSDCIPPHGLDLTPGGRDLKKVEDLQEMFIQYGFDPEKSCLVGYPLDGKIQLLSGTHRHEAAKRANKQIPVTLFLRSYVEAYWGTDKWPELIKDIPVLSLEEWPVEEDIPPSLEERYYRTGAELMNDADIGDPPDEDDSYYIWRS